MLGSTRVFEAVAEAGVPALVYASSVGAYSPRPGRIPVDERWLDKQITLRMGKANVRRWTDEILPLLDGGDPLDAKDFVTHVPPLREGARAYELFQCKQDGAIKIVLRP